MSLTHLTDSAKAFSDYDANSNHGDQLQRLLDEQRCAGFESGWEAAIQKLEGFPEAQDLLVRLRDEDRQQSALEDAEVSEIQNRRNAITRIK